MDGRAAEVDPLDVDGDDSVDRGLVVSAKLARLSEPWMKERFGGRPDLEEWKARYLAPERLREEGHLDPAGVEGLLAAGRLRGGADGETSRLWALLCFQRWFAHHHRGESL